MGIAKNRLVSVQPGKYFQVKDLDYYIMYLTNLEALLEITRREFKELHSIHWGIECASQGCQAIVWY